MFGQWDRLGMRLPIERPDRYPRVDFSGCNMPAMDLTAYESESKQVLKAQLRATLEVIPVYTWYAPLSGALIFANKRNADYLGRPKDHRRSIPRRDRTRSLR
jgi:PAS domain-containing protein